MNRTAIPSELVTGVELLCLDAGNTIVFLDHSAAAEAAQRAGFQLDAVAFERAEGAAKRRLEQGAGAMAEPLPDRDITPGWGAFMCTAVQIAADFDRETAVQCVRAMWRAHREFNLWRKIPEGLIDSVTRLRKSGVPVCVVSNSEGRLQILFEQLGISDAFDLVIDSHVLGVEKPDPRIFRHALSHFGVRAERALHLGDVVAVDIKGAQSAGVRAALIDPFGHYDGSHPEVPRVRDVTSVAQAILAARR